MKEKRKSAGTVGSVIAAVCILIYAFAVIQAAVRIYLKTEERKITAEQEFSNIAVTAVTAGSLGFMTDQFIIEMEKALTASVTIEALIISGPDGQYPFERRQGYAVKTVNNSPQFRNRFNISKVNYYRPLIIQDLRNANIRAAAGAFDFEEMTRVLKETLLLILCGFAISFFTMLLQLLTGTKNDKKQYAVPVQRQTNIPVQPVVEDTEPKGLYSPRSNIGWEEYTKDRLDSELHRCSSTEKDLTLVLMDFQDFTNDIMYKLASEEAISFFASRDLLFEYGRHGIVSILPGIDLDTGITKAERFNQRILEKFPNSRNSHSSLNIGITSRSGRLVDADRLIMEAQEALLKAVHDKNSSIVAFRSDPEKYRAFIASQSLKHS